MKKGLLFLCAVVFLFNSNVYAVEYSYQEITREGWSSIQLRGINNNNTIIGYDYRSGGNFIYQDNEYTDINFRPTAINDNGVVVGGDNIYENGIYSKLSAPDWTGLGIADINNNGEIIGTGTYNGVSSGFLYSQGQVSVIQPDGWSSLEMFDINNRGEIVGRGSGGNFKYSNGMFAIDSYYSYPNNWYAGISDKGTIAHTVATAYPSFLIYSDGTRYMIDAFTDLQLGITLLTGINNQDTVIGYGYDYMQLFEIGFTYSNGEYSFVVPDGAASSWLTGINDAGVIIGESYGENYSATSFIATPIAVVPEPISTTFFLIGGAFLFARCYRRHLR